MPRAWNAVRCAGLAVGACALAWGPLPERNAFAQEDAPAEATPAPRHEEPDTAAAPPPKPGSREVEMVYYRAPLARRAIEGIVRPLYATWLSGSVASQGIGSVFSSAPGFALEAGYRFNHHWLLFAGWEHVAYGVGAQSPYANLATASAFGNAFFAGARYTTSKRTISPIFDAALGYSVLEQDGQDNAGGSASATFPSVSARFGAGVSTRLFSKIERQVAIEPMVHLTFASVSSVSTTAAPAHAPEHDFSGDAVGGGMRIGLTIGISGTFDMPLTWE